MWRGRGLNTHQQTSTTFILSTIINNLELMFIGCMACSLPFNQLIIHSQINHLCLGCCKIMHTLVVVRSFCCESLNLIYKLFIRDIKLPPIYCSDRGDMTYFGASDLVNVVFQ